MKETEEFAIAQYKAPWGKDFDQVLEPLAEFNHRQQSLERYLPSPAEYEILHRGAGREINKSIHHGINDEMHLKISLVGQGVRLVQAPLPILERRTHISIAALISALNRTIISDACRFSLDAIYAQFSSLRINRAPLKAALHEKLKVMEVGLQSHAKWGNFRERVYDLTGLKSRLLHQFGSP